MFRNRMSNKYVPKPVAKAKRRRYAEDGLEVQDNFVGPIQPEYDTDLFFEDPFVGPPTEEMMMESESVEPLGRGYYEEEINPSVDISTTPEINQQNQDFYTIQKGDTLSKISKMTGMSIQDIAKMNNIKDINKIYAGAILKLDPSARIPNGTSNNTIAKTGGKKAAPINVAKKENLESNTIATPQLRRNIPKGDAVVISDPYVQGVNNQQVNNYPSNVSQASSANNNQRSGLADFFETVKYLGATPENNEYIADLQNSIYGLGIGSVIPGGSIMKGTKQFSNSVKNVIPNIPKVTNPINSIANNLNSLNKESYKQLIKSHGEDYAKRVLLNVKNFKNMSKGTQQKAVDLFNQAAKEVKTVGGRPRRFGETEQLTQRLVNPRLNPNNGKPLLYENGGLIGNIGDEIELTPEQIRYYKSLGYEFE